MRPECAWPGVLLLGALACGSVMAQAATAAGPGGSAAYVDREITGLQPADDAEDSSYSYDTAGAPRFLRLETRLATQPFDASRQLRLGFAAYGLLETQNHGTLSLDTQYTPNSGAGTYTLRQRGMPVAGGWQANHELGTITAPAPGITRLPTRVFIPSALLEGGSAEWENPSLGLQLQASQGQPGRLEILPAVGFERLGGQRTTLGLQWRLNPQDAGSQAPQMRYRGTTLAMQHEHAKDVSDSFAALPGQRITASSVLLAARHETETLRLQGQTMNTRETDIAGGRNGYWVDGEWDQGAFRHGAGVYRLEPGLSWAQQPLANDVAGAYVRSRWRTRLWAVEGSFDWLRPVSGRRAPGYFATGSVRHRFSRDLNLGAGFSARDYAGEAWTGYIDARWSNRWGSSGLRLELDGGTSQPAAQRLIYDKDWEVPQGWGLATSLGVGHYDAELVSGLPAETQWSFAASVAAPLGSRAALRGSFSTEHGSSGQRRTSANVGVNWQVDPRWSLEGNMVRSTGRSRQVLVIDPLAPPVTQTNGLSYHSYYVVLRYELQAGSRSVPLGGKPAEGGGRIEGTVYFDANRNGTQEASETGAPGVTVFLDNRYAVRTDSQGRFEFPFVATGTRTVSVRSDSLPLPWTVVDEGQARVDVRLRDSTQLSFPVQKAD